MNVRIDFFDPVAFEADITARFEEVRIPVQRAMAEQFKDIVISNLGPIGIDRPTQWAPLSNWAPYFYAQRVGRSYATLFETGQLLNSITLNAESAEAAVVFVDDDVCPYAAGHQTGVPDKNLPARPFFPMSPDGTVTSYTTNAVVDAARQELERELQ